MSRRRRRNPGPLARLFRLSTGGIALLVLLGLVLLFHHAVQSHRMEQLREREVQLEAQLEHARQDYVRAYSHWHEVSARDRVVQRASSELGMVEPDASPREVVALFRPNASKPDSEMPAMLAGLARGLDRFGQVREAAAVQAAEEAAEALEEARP